MASVFTRQIFRSIKGSLGRFLAIMGIAALGCGFFAGLQMSGPDMRLAADRYYDGTNLYDLRLVSTMGFEQADVDRIAAIEGVGEVMPSRSADAMARVAGEQLAVRVSSIDDAAVGSHAAGTFDVDSDDPAYLNRPVLLSGSWPSKAGECVVSDNEAKGVVRVGDKITLLYGTGDLADTFAVTELTVTGLVRSPSYPYTGSFGSTALGSGTIMKYLYVTPSSFSPDLPYTEVYASVPAARGFTSGTVAYEDAVNEVERRLEAAAPSLAQGRLSAVRADAQEQVDDGRDELAEKRAEADAELADARAKLDDARAELDDARAQLADARGELDDARRQIADSAAQIETGQSQLDDGRAELARQRAQATEQMDAAAAELADSRAQLDANAAQLDEAQAQVDAGRTAYDAQVTAALAGLAAQGVTASTPAEASAALGAQLEQVAQQIAGIEAQLAALSEDDPARPALEATLAQLQAGEAQLQGAKDGMDQLVAAGAQLDASQQTIDAGRSQVSDGYAQVEAGETALATKRAEAEAQFADAQARLDASAAELADGRRRLDDARAKYASGEADYESGRADYAAGLAEYEDGEAEYESQVAEANQKLDDAAKELDDAQADVDAIEAPDIYVLDRTKSEGVMAYRGDSERMDSIADVFPAIFFLVAALVSLTTMTRMVEDDRVEIGTYKALGYSTARIAQRYVVYAALASGLGAVIGIAILSQVLPYIVTSSYSIIYDVPLLPFPMPVDLPTALLSGGLGVGVTLLATWGAVLSSLREVPASLMLPRAPKAGKRILLERVTPVWARLSFSWKVTCRNLFRYKRRLLMTIVGISGCTALLLVGFGLHDSIWDIIDCQYGPIVHYDAIVSLTGDASSEDVDSVEKYLEASGDVTDIHRVAQSNVLVAKGADQSATTADTERATDVIPEDSASFGEAVTFRDRRTHAPVAFGSGGVVLTEKLATLLDVRVGDKVSVFDQDEVGNATGAARTLTVTGIAENYVGNYVYVGRDAWSEAGGEERPFSTFYASATPDAAVRTQLSDELGGMDNVSTVSFTDEVIETYRSMLSVVDLVVVVLIVSAAALAFIVLYNLTNINVSERVREIASLKVLGFTRREVYAYIFREVALLAVLGDLLGMVLGTWLETFVITTAEVDVVMFGRTIHPLSYAYAFALTLLFTGIVILAMRRKLDRVDMVESLKSVE